MSSLVHDYLHDYAKVDKFFNGNFRDITAFQDQTDRVKSRELPCEQVIAVLEDQNERYGGSTATLANIHRLNDNKTCAVVTGQQVGLFSGPLYTIYKTVTVIKLAEMLNEHCDGHFVPVFWMASDDHDLEEIDHIEFINIQNQVEKIVCPIDVPNDKAPASTFTLTSEISHCIQKLEESTHDSEFKEGILSDLSNAYQPNRSFVDAFAAWMTRLFGAYGIIFIDATHPDLKSIGKGIFKQEVDGNSPSTDRILETSRILKKHDYKDQVQLHKGILNVFYGEQKRETIRIQEPGFSIGNSNVPMSKQDLLLRLEKESHLFSPNVLFRPLYQDALLPTVAYVGGPGEIAYFAQIKSVYDAFGFAMPIIYPRKNVTLLEKKIATVLDQYGLSVEDIWCKGDGMIHDVMEQQIPQSVVEMLDHTIANLHKEFQSLKKEIVRIEPTLKKTTDQALGKIEHQFKFLEKKILQASKRRHEIIHQQLIKTVNTIYPNRKPQERVLNIVPFLMKYGEPLIEQLFDSIDVDDTDQQIIAL